MKIRTLGVPSDWPALSHSLGPLGGSGLSWQSDIPLTAWEPSGDVQLTV